MCSQGNFEGQRLGKSCAWRVQNVGKSMNHGVAIDCNEWKKFAEFKLK